MNKNLKVTFIGFIITMFSVGIGLFVYYKLYSLKTYHYTTVNGQEYSLKYFPNAEVVNGAVIAEKLDAKELTDKGPMIVAYFKSDLGILMSISEPINEPLTKTCSGTDGFAFDSNGYEVCKVVIDDRVIILLAKIGNDDKYFVATVAIAYDAKKILQNRDKNYIYNYTNFNLMNYEKELKIIFNSIHPISQEQK